MKPGFMPADCPARCVRYRHPLADGPFILAGTAAMSWKAKVLPHHLVQAGAVRGTPGGGQQNEQKGVWHGVPEFNRSHFRYVVRGQGEDYDAMQGNKLAQAIQEAVQVPRVKGPTGTVWMPEEPFNLEEAVAMNVETENEARTFAESGALGLLPELWRFEPLLHLYWEGDSKDLPSFRLGMLDIGHSKGYVCLALGAPAWWVVAAVEPKESRDYWIAFVKDFLEANGEDYHLTLFGTLPSLIHNLAPDKLPPHLLKECFWEWMENAQDVGLARWEDLRDELLKGLDPDGGDLNPEAVLDVLGGLVQVEDSDEGSSDEGMAPILPVEACRYLLDLYFGLSYRSDAAYPAQEETLKALHENPLAAVQRLRAMQPVY